MEKKRSGMLMPKVKKADKNLDRYLETEVFKEKFEKLKNIIDTYGLPKIDK